MQNRLDYDDIRVHQSLDILLRFDQYLLKNNLSERSLTHKLAEHTQSIFNDWNVDCEFNRNLGGPKNIVIDPRQILSLMADTLETNHYLQHLEINLDRDDRGYFVEQMKDLERQLRNPELLWIDEADVVYFLLTLENGERVPQAIFPDMIIHHRGTRDNNIVIEAKKTNNRSKKERGYDLTKLIVLTTSSDFMYKKGYFIELPVLQDLERFKSFSDSTAIGFNAPVYRINPKYSN